MWHDETYPAILKEYVQTGKARMAYVNFPLSIHAHAHQAAIAAMCAGAQNKFWQMHDALFGAQDQWVPLPDPSAKFEELAGKAGVDVNALKACVSSHKMRPLIEADHEKAVRAGVRATPSFFIGSQLLEGVQLPADLRKVLDAALAGAK
jgi:protein-disulfide isomerase